jgi:acyl-CoA thioesterase
MGDLAEDTAVEALGGGLFRATVSPNWAVPWGDGRLHPNGGYLSAITLRAAALISQLPRPASLHCQYLEAPEFGAVELEASVLRERSRAACLEITLSQRGTPMVRSTVWATAAELPGPSACWARAPSFPPPEALPAVSFPGSSLWSNVEVRASGPQRAGDGTTLPVLRGWNRLHARSAFGADLWLDACRCVLLLDLCPFPAASMALGLPPPKLVAASLDQQASFHELAPGSDWLLAEGQGTCAGGGLLAGRGLLWSRNGALVATGAQQMLCRS